MGEVTKNFSKEDEELIRKFLFTNPHGKDSFIYPQQLFSGEEFSPIISEYSRTHKSLQDRVLSYLDKEKLEETRALLPMMPKLMEITRNPDGSLLSTKKIESFNRLWILRKGHMSAKELTGFVGYSEDISDLVDKHITGHPLVSPLVKSTRYLPFDKVIGMEDPDISNLPQPEQYYEYIAYMGKRYQETTKALTDFVMGHKYTNEVIGYLNRPENLERAVAKWAEEQQFIRGSPVSQKELSEQKERILKGLQDEKVREEIQGFVLDYSRVYLLSSIKNSLGYALDARALAEVISSMVSSPRIEDRTRGQAIWDEAKKIAPVLFGSPDSIKLSKNQDLSSWAKENVQIVYHGDDRKMTTIYSPHFFDGNLDSLNLAMALFPHMEASFYAINYSLRDLDTTKLLNKIKCSL